MSKLNIWISYNPLESCKNGNFHGIKFISKDLDWKSHNFQISSLLYMWAHNSHPATWTSYHILIAPIWKFENIHLILIWFIKILVKFLRILLFFCFLEYIFLLNLTRRRGISNNACIVEFKISYMDLYQMKLESFKCTRAMF